MTDLTLRLLCGQLLVGGFAGPTLSPTFREALERGERGGAILFRRNLTGSLADVIELNRSLCEAAPGDLPPLLGIDQEGGRVTRLGPPILRVPTMRALGRIGDAELVRRVGAALGQELASLGFTIDFAPVLDVDTCATNPIIGDRSFSSDPFVVRRLGEAFVAGLESAGVLACGKHFPGHGDTTKDSHKELPRVDRDRAGLVAIECVPFRASAASALMTAHVVYPAWDPDEPATLSRRIAHDLLRTELGYQGLLISDDLEMKAVADRLPIEESAVKAVRAGCDLLLVCASEDLQARAHEALVKAAEADRAFRALVESSVRRSLAVRSAHPPRPVEISSGVVGGATSQAVAAELEARGAFA